jgi:HPt (histidine-containing phosphotransfer) domain-containing protein
MLIPVNEAVYDLTELQKIASGDKDFVVQMLRLFIKDTQQNLLNIQDWLELGDFQAIRDVMHKMKPSVKILRLSEAYELIIQLEEIQQYEIELFKLTSQGFNDKIQVALKQLEKIISFES